MAEQYRYAAFISYSSKDAPFARRLHRALEGFGIPASLGKFDLLGKGGKRNRIYPVFRDREEMPSGSLERGVNDALGNSNALIVVCSPNSAQSSWVEKEIEYFETRRGADKIFAVIAGGDPHASEGALRQEEECFPPSLRRRTREAAGKAEIVAGDARPGFDGFRTAWLKVVAGMIGVTPGQIVNRDRSARRQRLLQAMLMSALVLLCVGFAYTQRVALTEFSISWARYKPFVHEKDELEKAQPGATFQDCAQGSADCPAMVVLPEGTFMMGAAPDEQDAAQSVLHRVSIRRFAVSRNDITFIDWDACAKAGGCSAMPHPEDSQWGRGPRPVINVSWTDAQQYVVWLSQMTGQHYRLLSEAEWEYAARGTRSAGATPRRFPWGDENPVCDVNAPNGAAVGCSEHGTWPVGSFRPNAFGLYDMAGNVYQWVEDCYLDQYDPSKHDGAPVENGNCIARVLRGGYWRSLPSDLRSATRVYYYPSERYSRVGFRVARSL